MIQCGECEVKISEFEFCLLSFLWEKMIYLNVRNSNLCMSLGMKNGTKLHVLLALLEIDEIKL